MEKNDDDRDDLIFDLIKRRYDTENNRITNLDSKAASLIGFVSVVVGLVVGGGTFKISIISAYFHLFITYFTGIGVLLSSIFCGLMAYKERKFLVAPNIQTLVKKYKDKPYSTTLRKNAMAMDAAIQDMERTNKRKANYITVSWILLIAGFVIVFIFVMMFAWPNGPAATAAKKDNNTQSR